jgi:hypothetical protein
MLRDPLVPNTSADFTITEMDESIKLATKISSYALLVQTSTQSIWLPPSASPSEVAQSSDSLLLISAIFGIIITIAVIAVLVLVFLKRKNTSPIVSTPTSIFNFHLQENQRTSRIAK